MAAETSESLIDSESNDNMVRSVDSTTDTTNDALNDEDRLRQEKIGQWDFLVMEHQFVNLSNQNKNLAA